MNNKDSWFGRQSRFLFKMIVSWPFWRIGIGDFIGEMPINACANQQKEKEGVIYSRFD